MKIENKNILQSTSSPDSVFDFSLFMLLGQDETARLQAPSIAKGAGRDAPSLESITTASSSSLSSFSSSLSSFSTQYQEDYGSCVPVTQQRKRSIHVQQQKRSIFSHYWTRTGQKPIELTPSTEASTEDSSESSVQAEATQNSGHKRQDQLFPQDKKVAVPCTIPRRSIMGERASSYSNPSFSTFNPRALTKKSASQSCLRTSRFSGSNSRTRSNSCSSAVGFSDQVDVVIYQKPAETFSEEGWSRFFSI
jgi:hypothetical protein